MDTKPKKRRKSGIDWDNIKVTFVSASSVGNNPLNPACELSPEEREKRIISIAVGILNNDVERMV
ncbi:MAG: hypothetical protein KKF78_03320 [Candidatus Omnitrophica bacterium]|nr:hypothetical protein [Candidatus Omnitrophota bacterium]MBU1996168.1 hypothetical protein [Candidatus Omnitrophota bacterium]